MSLQSYHPRSNLSAISYLFAVPDSLLMSETGNQPRSESVYFRHSHTLLFLKIPLPGTTSRFSSSHVPCSESLSDIFRIFSFTALRSPMLDFTHSVVYCYSKGTDRIEPYGKCRRYSHRFCSERGGGSHYDRPLHSPQALLGCIFCWFGK
jgi:hypothetical protein